MDEQNKKWNRVLRLLLLVPLILGTVGLLQTGDTSFWDALFNSIQMFFLNYEDPAPNALVNISRFLAPVIAAGNVLMAIASASRYIRARLIYLLGHKPTTAIYGDEQTTSLLARQLKCGTIIGSAKFLKADRYLLMWDEEKNLKFYTRHEKQLKNRQVYLKCSALRTQEIAGDKLKLISSDEIAARLFWQQADLYHLYESKGSGLNIVFIGFGFLGEELLNCCLQMNIFSPTQHFTYEVFGEDKQYLQLHHELSQISDKVLFHEEAWEDSLKTIRDADFVVVCEQKNQLALIRDLLFAIPAIHLQVFAAEPKLIGLLEENERCHTFDWQGVSLQLENIFDDKTLNRAKAINLRYAHLYRGIEETDANSCAEWSKLNSFLRYSNISAADYHEIRLQMLRGWKVNKADDLTSEQMNLLAELEHIRWCRFYYLNNWQYCAGIKDPVRRLHKDLRPYEKLSEEEKEKDRENIRVLMEI